MKAAPSAEARAAPAVAEQAARPRAGAAHDVRSALIDLQQSIGNGALRRLLDGRPGPETERALRLRGNPLPPPLRQLMERGFGQDFGGVRLHLGPSAEGAARAAGALAFTHGEHVVFGRGAPALCSPAGRLLLAHELAHVLQQRRGGPVLAPGVRAAVERGAERAAAAVSTGAAAVTVEGASAVGVARESEVRPTELPKLDLTEVLKDRAYTASIDGVLVFQIELAPALTDRRFGVSLNSLDRQLAVRLDGSAEVVFRLQPQALAQLAAKGYDVRMIDARRSRREDTGDAVFLDSAGPPAKPPAARPPIRKPEPARPVAAANAATAPPRRPQPQPQPQPRAAPGASKPQAPVASQAGQPIAPKAAIPAPEPLGPQQLDAIAPQVTAELAEAEPLVVSLIADGAMNLSTRAVNEYRGLQQRLADDAKFLGELEPRSGARSKEVHAALARVMVLQQMLEPMTRAAVEWHAANSYGRSLGMLNDAAGTWLAGAGLRQFDKGGLHYVSGGLAMTGALVVAVVDSSEKLITFGYHDAATAVAEAYERGDISWVDADRIMRKAFWRSLLTAAVASCAGVAASRIGTLSAEALGMAPTAVRFGATAGLVTGGLTSATTLGTQTLLTWGLAGDFSSPQARAIWNSGIPQGREWAIAIPLGMLLGGLGGARAVQTSNAKLIGSMVETPSGPVRIVGVTPGGQVIARPLGAGLDLPPLPPAGDIVFTYDPVTRVWRMPVTGTAAPTTLPSGNVAPAVDAAPPQASKAGASAGAPNRGAGRVARGTQGPRGPGAGGAGGRSPLDPSPAPLRGPVTLYLPGRGVPPAVTELAGRAKNAVAGGRLQLLDELGRPINVRSDAFGNLVPSMDTSLLNETRLVDASGQPLAGQVPPPWRPLLDATGKPSPFAPRSGPLVLDLQAGTPAYGSRLAAESPGTQVLGAEGGNWLLAYRRLYPTDAGDLSLSLQIARNTPAWPDTPAWRTSFEGLTQPLPWELDPATHLFPQAGPVRMLPDLAQPRLGAQFFPARGTAGRLIPRRPADVSGFAVEPPLALPAAADRILLRRPFALGTADAATSDLMGRRIAEMLKPGGYVEVRPTVRADPSQAPDFSQVQIDAIRRAIPGSIEVRVEAADVAHFQESGAFPEGADAVAREMIRAAAADATGLGKGAFEFIVRIYAPTDRR